MIRTQLKAPSGLFRQLASRRGFSTQFAPKSLPLKTSGSAFRMAFPLIFGSVASVTLVNSMRKPVFNEIHATSPIALQLDQNTSVTYKKTRLGGTVNYSELCIGSMTGLFLGIIVGKLSTAICFLGISGYLLLQFLESRNIITIPWLSVVTLGSQRINLKDLFFNKPSFKFSFILAFGIAAMNV